MRHGLYHRPSRVGARSATWQPPLRPIWKGHMTRDFNNQRRENPRSDSRGSSSRRFEEKRPSRPARPRLNRDVVDRAWENGARQNHPDYRTRNTSNTQSHRENRRPDQRANRYPAQTNTSGRKPYGNRRDDYRPGERSSRSNA